MNRSSASTLVSTCASSKLGAATSGFTEESTVGVVASIVTGEFKAAVAPEVGQPVDFLKVL